MPVRIRPHGADDFLQHILEGQDSRPFIVVVDHERQPVVTLLEPRQSVLQRQVFQHLETRSRQPSEAVCGHLLCGIGERNALHMQDTEGSIAKPTQTANQVSASFTPITCGRRWSRPRSNASISRMKTINAIHGHIVKPH